jgi:type IX secretion system PorP/SprF family membrane protein
MATGAYQLRLETGTLNFGLRGGIYNTVIDQGQLNFREDNDLLDTKTRVSAMVPSFDFGLYYYTSNFYAGLSINHLTKHRFNFENLVNNQAYYLRRHVFISSGYVFKTEKNMLIKPSILIKYAGTGTFNVDINTNFMFNELFWVGIGLRNTSSLNFLVDFNVTDYLRIGYSYDMGLTKINHYSNGSHELLIGLDFNLRKTSFTTPRYL